MRQIVFICVLCLGLSPLAGAVELPLAADYLGLSNIHSIGQVRAVLHVRKDPSLNDAHFAVLALADKTGDFSVGRNYRFSQVTVNPMGHWVMRLESMGGNGLGRFLCILDAEVNGNDLQGHFVTNQIAPDGGLVEGTVQLRLRSAIELSDSLPQLSQFL